MWKYFTADRKLARQSYLLKVQKFKLNSKKYSNWHKISLWAKLMLGSAKSYPYNWCLYAEEAKLALKLQILFEIIHLGLNDTMLAKFTQQHITAT